MANKFENIYDIDGDIDNEIICKLNNLSLEPDFEKIIDLEQQLTIVTATYELEIDLKNNELNKRNQIIDRIMTDKVNIKFEKNNIEFDLNQIVNEKIEIENKLNLIFNEKIKMENEKNQITIEKIQIEIDNSIKDERIIELEEKFKNLKIHQLNQMAENLEVIKENKRLKRKLEILSLMIMKKTKKSE